MSESKHTPGPWWAHIWDILDNRTLEPTGKKRMDIQYQIFPDIKVGRTLATLEFENEANARLIAAAPELLDLLEKALDQCPGENCVIAWHKAGRDLVDKIKGES